MIHFAYLDFSIQGKYILLMSKHRIPAVLLVKYLSFTWRTQPEDAFPIEIDH